MDIQWVKEKRDALLKDVRKKYPEIRRFIETCNSLDKEEKDTLLIKLDRSVNAERYIPDSCELFDEGAMLLALMRSRSRPSPEEIPEGYPPESYFCMQIIAYDIAGFSRRIALGNHLWLLADSNEKHYDGDVLLVDPLRLRTDKTNASYGVPQDRIEELLKSEFTKQSPQEYPDYDPAHHYSRQYDHERTSFHKKLQAEQKTAKENDPWEKCASAGDLSPIGIRDAVMRRTLHGGTAFVPRDMKTRNEYGYIGVDSGTIAFMPLDDAKTDVNTVPQDSAVLRDFHGTMQFVVIQESLECGNPMEEAFWKQFRLYIKGTGKISGKETIFIAPEMV